MKEFRCTDTYKAWVETYKPRMNIKRKQLRAKTKELVISHYCNGDIKCACCGEKTYSFLTVDHISGGGTKHRKNLNGETIYHWLKKNNYPEGYQILCFNCNCGSYMNNDICPHKLK